MPGHIADNHADFALILFIKLEEIVVIPSGFVAVNAFSGNVQSRDLRILCGQEFLLDLHRQIHGLMQPEMILEFWPDLVEGLDHQITLISGMQIQFDGEVATGQFFGGCRDV